MTALESSHIALLPDQLGYSVALSAIHLAYNQTPVFWCFAFFASQMFSPSCTTVAGMQ
jgi:hypothetical protein